MLTGVYLVGILAVGTFVACCVYAQQGAQWARAIIWAETCVFGGLATVALLLAFVVMLVGGKVSDTGASAGWWTQGQGQQFLVAVLGSLALASAGLSLRQRQFLSAASLMIVAAVLFGFWSLLVEAAWSGRGPLAFVRP
jgi:hypothetical protein